MDYDTLTSGGLGAAIVGVLWVFVGRIGRWATRQRWTHTVQSEDIAKISAERDAFQLRCHELELRTASAEAKALAYREHTQHACEERDKLIRRIAGLEEEKNANLDDK